MKEQDKSSKQGKHQHSPSDAFGELAKTGLGLLRFGLDHADSLTKIAKDTLTRHVEEGDCESALDANRKKEETNDRRASE